MKLLSMRLKPHTLILLALASFLTLDNT
ncbi:hypothetical protein A2U01_0093515, partial [Trifolium medium]|nr:hypothetical protein [Trifolium medium]